MAAAVLISTRHIVDPFCGLPPIPTHSPVVAGGVSGLESLAEFVAIELAIAVLAAIALVGMAPITVTIEGERTAAAGILLAGFTPLVVAVLMGNAFDIAPIAAVRIVGPIPITAVDDAAGRAGWHRANRRDECKHGQPSCLVRHRPPPADGKVQAGCQLWLCRFSSESRPSKPRLSSTQDSS